MWRDLDQLLSEIKRGTCENPTVFNISSDDRRRFQRISVTPEFYVLDSERSRVFDAVDLSSGGICLIHKGWRFLPGDLICFDFIYRDHFILKNGNAIVARVDPKCMGCKFVNISPIIGDKLTRFVMKQMNRCKV